MYRCVFASRTAQRFPPGIVPNIGAVAPATPDPKGIGVGSADLEPEHDLMLVTVERPHPAVGLIPHAEVLELEKDGLACLEQLPHMAPIHAHKRNAAVARKRGGVSECQSQEACECFGRHFANPHGEFAMANASKPCHVPVDRNVVWRVGEYEGRALATHHQVKYGSVSSIPANQTMAPETPNIPCPRDSRRWIIGG